MGQVVTALQTEQSITERRRRATTKELQANPDQATIVETVATWKDKRGKSAVFLAARLTAILAKQMILAVDGDNDHPVA